MYHTSENRRTTLSKFILLFWPFFAGWISTFRCELESRVARLKVFQGYNGTLQTAPRVPCLPHRCRSNRESAKRFQHPPQKIQNALTHQTGEAVAGKSSPFSIPNLSSVLCLWNHLATQSGDKLSDIVHIICFTVSTLLFKQLFLWRELMLGQSFLIAKDEVDIAFVIFLFAASYSISNEAENELCLKRKPTIDTNRLGQPQWCDNFVWVIWNIWRVWYLWIWICVEASFRCWAQATIWYQNRQKTTGIPFLKPKNMTLQMLVPTATTCSFNFFVFSSIWPVQRTLLAFAQCQCIRCSLGWWLQAPHPVVRPWRNRSAGNCSVSDPNGGRNGHLPLCCVTNDGVGLSDIFEKGVHQLLGCMGNLTSLNVAGSFGMT